MSRFHFSSALLLVALGCCVSASPLFGQPASRPEYKKTATNLVSFGIPFSIVDSEDRFIEVQLYLSKNRGQSWQFYARESIAAKEFPFTSTGDGVYWFALRTLDRDRRIHPEGPMNPELEVVVDSKTPQVDFRIQTDSAGRLVCRWNAQDEHIDPASIKLSFRPLLDVDNRNNGWIPVPYRPVSEAKGGAFADQYAWWPETAALEVLVQFQISDTAGNTAVEERQIVVPRSARRSTNQSMVIQGSPMSGTPAPANPLAVETQRIPVPQSGNGLETKSTKPPVVWDSNTVSNDRLNEQRRVNWPDLPDRRPEMNLPENRAGLEERPLHTPSPTGVLTPITPPPSNAGPNSLDLSKSSLPSHQNTHQTPFQNTGFSSSTDELPTSVMHAPIHSIPTSKTESLNQRRFRLNYTFDQLDPEQVEKVVLWMTYDAGHTWTAYGEDADNQSPFPIQLENPGLYGFRIVFHTKDGRTSQAPKSGDDADYWVRLDLEAPQAKITGAPYGRDEHAGSLIIQWTATDDLLASRPIAIDYSVEPNGPWTTIAAGLENIGNYIWKVGAEVPNKVYLRLTATDAAGNFTYSQTNQPIDLSGLVPKARILGVEK